MSKHTPGPWATYDKAAYGIAIAKGGVAGQNIASIQQYVGLTRAETIANARLIAAAPDMLAALRAILQLHIAHHNAPEHAAARAAIAKAEGSQT